MQYAIYDPALTTTTPIDSYSNGANLTYVSNSSMAFYGGLYWAIVDGTAQGLVEGSPGQQIWVTTSPDAVSWSTPVQPFRDPAYCTNPISSATLEWQPNLVVVGDELWCTWTGQDGYISKLPAPGGKWTNHRFEFVGQQVFISANAEGAPTAGRSVRATIDGITDWLPFFSQNPIVLSSGVVACPLTLYTTSSLSTQTNATAVFTKAKKYNALFNTVDGQAWSMALVDTSDWGDFIAWEPFVVEHPDGHVYVYTRNLDARVADEDYMLVSLSDDGGKTFGPSVSTKMLVPSTRAFARQVTDKRWMMVHCDQRQNTTGNVNQSLSAKGRRNGALFVSRRGVDDFVAGVPFSGDDPCMNYPQFIVGPGGIDLFVHWTSGAGVTVRRSLKMTHVGSLPADDTAYINPRGLNLVTPNDPEPQPDHFYFNGMAQVKSAAPVAATVGVTYAVWAQWEYDGNVLIDCRSPGVSMDAPGHVFLLKGLALGGLNFFHDQIPEPNKPTFLAAAIDNAAGTVTVYSGAGGAALTSKMGHFRSVLFNNQPANGETVSVNGVVYTFTTTAAAANDVAIGANVAATITNLSAKLSANAVNSFNLGGGSRLVMARTDLAAFTVTSGSAQIVAETSIPLAGTQASIGMRAVPSSSLADFTGKMFEARGYNTALTQANLVALYNEKAAGFGYPTITGGAAPSAPTLHLDPANPDTVNFPPLGAPARTEVVDANTLRLHGEASAAVELPFGAQEITIRYKLGATPTAGEQYTVASFGTSDGPVRLYVDSSGKLYANGTVLGTPVTGFNDVTLIVSTRKITTDSFEKVFAGKPRCFLGNAYPQGLLAASKSVDFDVAGMSVVKV